MDRQIWCRDSKTDTHIYIDGQRYTDTYRWTEIYSMTDTHIDGQTDMVQGQQDRHIHIYINRWTEIYSKTDTHIDRYGAGTARWTDTHIQMDRDIQQD